MSSSRTSAINKAAIGWLFLSMLKATVVQSRLEKALKHVIDLGDTDAYSIAELSLTIDIIKLLPEQDRITFLNKSVKHPLSINTLSQIVPLLLAKEKLPFLQSIVIVNNPPTIYPNLLFGTVLRMLEDNERLAVAEKHSNIIGDDDDFQSIISALPNAHKDAFAQTHADKIHTQEGLISILTKYSVIDSASLAKRVCERITINYLFLFRAMKSLAAAQSTEFLLEFHAVVLENWELQQLIKWLPRETKPMAFLFFAKRSKNPIPLQDAKLEKFAESMPTVIIETQQIHIESKTIPYCVKSISCESTSKIIIEAMSKHDALIITKFFNYFTRSNKQPKFTINPMENWQRKLVMEGNLSLGLSYLKIRFISQDTHQKLIAELKKLANSSPYEAQRNTGKPFRL